MVKPMANHECVIGLVRRNDDSELVTVEELKEHIAKRIEYNRYLTEAGLSHCHWLRYKEWSLKDYCDRRKSTDLTRFDFCPMCGKKIDWKRIKEETK